MDMPQKKPAEIATCGCRAGEHWRY